MKTLIKIILFFLSVYTSNAQVSPFQGIWKWTNVNNTFYVYVKSETIDSGSKMLSIDYIMYESINNQEVVKYSSKINNQFHFAGGFLSEYFPISRSGNFFDCSHPQTTDCFWGRMTLEYLPASGMNSLPKLHWKLLEAYDNIQGYSTNNPPSGFNLPTDIILTKVP